MAGAAHTMGLLQVANRDVQAERFCMVSNLLRRIGIQHELESALRV
jgi:hypothetical protein